MSDVFKSADYAREALEREAAAKSSPPLLAGDLTDAKREELMNAPPFIVIGPSAFPFCTCAQCRPKITITPIPVNKTINARPDQMSSYARIREWLDAGRMRSLTVESDGPKETQQNQDKGWRTRRDSNL